MANKLYIAEFGFHVFKSGLPQIGSDVILNIYFYLPRKVVDPDKSVMSNVERYIFCKLEDMLPGIGEVIRYRKFVSPVEFIGLHGLHRRVTSMIMPGQLFYRKSWWGKKFPNIEKRM